MKKITKNFVVLGSTTLAVVAPIITVVSCGGGSASGLGDLDVLSPALSKLEADSRKTVEDYIVSPSSTAEGVRVLTIPKLESSELGDVTELTSLSKTYTLYTAQELADHSSELPAGNINLNSEEEMANAFLDLNKAINAEIGSLFSTEVSQGHADLTLTKFESTFRYVYEFNKDARTFSFKVYHFEEHETDLTRWIDSVFFNPTTGIKALTKQQMGNVNAVAGQSYEFFNGGGIMGWHWMNKQYHLNGNYLVNDQVPTTPSTIDPLYTADFDQFLTNWHGENVPTTQMVGGHRDLERDYQKFDDGDADDIKDITITSKSKMDIVNQKLYIEFTFHKGGTVWLDSANNPYRQTVKDDTETVRRLIEIPDAVPNGVSTPTYSVDQNKFNSALAQLSSLLSLTPVTNLINNFLLNAQPELRPFVSGIGESVKFIKDNHYAKISLQGYNGLTPEAKAFQENLYNTLCADSRVSMDDFLRVGDIVGELLKDTQHIESALANITTSQQAALLSAGYGLFYGHDTIVNWTPAP